MTEHTHDDCVHCLRRDNERMRKELAEARARPVSLAARIDAVIELLNGLPMEFDENGKVIQRGPPLISREQALKALDMPDIDE